MAPARADAAPYCRCHCRRCGSHFSSLEAFDSHHEGSGEILRPCRFPDDLTEDRGVCRISDPTSPLDDVTVYSTVRDTGVAERLRRALDSPAQAQMQMEAAIV